jgi:hypothetical protein
LVIQLRGLGPESSHRGEQGAISTSDIKIKKISTGRTDDSKRSDRAGLRVLEVPKILGLDPGAFVKPCSVIANWFI